MKGIADAFSETIGKCDLPDDAVVRFWTRMIAALEDEDWDTQSECVGGISPLWDKAYFTGHPYDDGYLRQKFGELNPYPIGSDAYDKWQEGYDDWLHEQD